MTKSLAPTILAAAVALFCAGALFAQTAEKKDAPPQAKKKQAPLPGAGTGGNTPHETTSAVIDGNRVMVVYGRPFSKHPRTGEVRKIWGGLVPWGKVWRTGSDEATLLVTQQPIELGGATVPAGAHSLWLLPKEDGTAKLIVNKQIGQWGVPRPGQDPKEVYDEAKDVVRADLKKEPLETPVDQFRIVVERNASGGGTLKLMWDDAQYSAPFAVKK